MTMRPAPIAAVTIETTATGAAPGKSLVGRLRTALAVRRERSALKSLDERMLADIGLSRADAYRESHRSFMDLPLPGNNKVGKR
jgi:uncharacterized protein YjiS (DUF1127 family)